MVRQPQLWVTSGRMELDVQPRVPSPWEEDRKPVLSRLLPLQDLGNPCKPQLGPAPCSLSGSSKEAWKMEVRSTADAELLKPTVGALSPALGIQSQGAAFRLRTRLAAYASGFGTVCLMIPSKPGTYAALALSHPKTFPSPPSTGILYNY